MNKEQLIYEYMDNDKLNIEKIVKDYSGYIRTVVTNSSKNYFSPEDVEEIVTDTFFILWKNSQKLEKDRVLKFYLTGITRNLIKEKSRMTKNLVDIDDYIEKLTDKENTDIIYEKREKLEYLENILRHMKNIDVEIFEYFYYYDRSIKEIATIMQLSEFSVKSKLYRIRKKLRKELEKGGYRNNG